MRVRVRVRVRAKVRVRMRGRVRVGVSQPTTLARRHQQRRVKPLGRSPQPPARGGREQ